MPGFYTRRATVACPIGGGPIIGCAIQANCDAGDVAVGGGFMVDPEGTRWSIDESFPVPSPPSTATAWAVDAKLDVTAVNDPFTAQSCQTLSGGPNPCRLTAAVICADVTPAAAVSLGIPVRQRAISR